MEKTLLIGDQALEISRLKKQIELQNEKINQLWLDDFISSENTSFDTRAWSIFSTASSSTIFFSIFYAINALV